MLSKKVFGVLKNFGSGLYFNFPRKCSAKTCLYISGKYGHEMGSTVFADLDIDDTLRSQDVTFNLRARKLNLQIEPEAIVKGLRYLAWLDQEWQKLDAQRSKLVALMNESDPVAKEKLGFEYNEIKKEMKSNLNYRWNIEDSSVVDFLRLPNRLHPSTPIASDIVLHQTGDCVASSRSHVDLATESEELEVSNNSPRAYYLIGRLARLELDLCENVQTHLLDSGLDMLSCPDFVRSVVLEGCEPGSFKNPSGFLSLAETSDLGGIDSGHGVHLTGGASLHSMAAYFVKYLLANPVVLPANYFCIGRRYVARNSVEKFSLFETQQSTAVQLFSVSFDEASMKIQFDHLINLVRAFYDDLGMKYRIVSKNASELDNAQSLKHAVEMFSPSENRFVEVGHLSTYDDYLSKRIMLKYTEGEELRNLFVVSGTFLDVTKVIACIIEQTDGKLSK